MTVGEQPARSFLFYLHDLIISKPPTSAYITMPDPCSRCRVIACQRCKLPRSRRTRRVKPTWAGTKKSSAMFVLSLGSCTALVQTTGADNTPDFCPTEHTYPHPSIPGLTCELCPAGHYVEDHCTPGSTRSTCLVCPDNKYQPCPSSNLRCHSCSDCSAAWLDGRSAPPILPCSQTQDNICQCPQDRFWSLVEPGCKVKTPCGPGQGVAHQATYKSDTVCITCQDGFFSNETSLVQVCGECRRCEEEGLETREPCNTTSNAVCSALPSVGTLPSTSLQHKDGLEWWKITLIVMSAVGALLAGVGIIGYIRKKMTTNNAANGAVVTYNPGNSAVYTAVPPVPQNAAVPRAAVPPAHQNGAIPHPAIPPASQNGAVPHAAVPPASQNGAVPHAAVPPASQNGAVPHAAVPPASQNGVVLHAAVPPASQNGAVPHAAIPPAFLNGAVPHSAVPPSSQNGAVPYAAIPPASLNGAVSYAAIPPASSNGAVPCAAIPPSPSNSAVPHTAFPQNAAVSSPAIYSENVSVPADILQASPNGAIHATIPCSLANAVPRPSSNGVVTGAAITPPLANRSVPAAVPPPSTVRAVYAAAYNGTTSPQSQDNCGPVGQPSSVVIGQPSSVVIGQPSSAVIGQPNSSLIAQPRSAASYDTAQPNSAVQQIQFESGPTGPQTRSATGDQPQRSVIAEQPNSGAESAERSTTFTACQPSSAVPSAGPIEYENMEQETAPRGAGESNNHTAYHQDSWTDPKAIIQGCPVTDNHDPENNTEDLDQKDAHDPLLELPVNNGSRSSRVEAVQDSKDPPNNADDALEKEAREPVQVTEYPSGPTRQGPYGSSNEDIPGASQHR
ncbi:PREDICTED: nascent polypeptide-associated complex subunit alpha, muscle-specific form-like isoform X2 [Branchiostoma belcheri]|uniref:Nascent polypeptide-associated complex subunit alpha, muscle-specific form-like isoform X2 n=1 Tax=Branchiostoma belcheri TaxID=7741 RepID=A0A6P4YT00_BRABE|nr:PREDICTED: nascent polypeptide-associated complex subunit alpha, muscle-specific form-like isoform X2 [Branchiostoma belcheri]